MVRVVGDSVAVRRVWRTTLLGAVTTGTATYSLRVSDGAGGWLYLQSNDTLAAGVQTYPLTETGGEWLADYTVPASLAGLEVHEIATHSVYGPLSRDYRVSVADAAALLSTPSRKFTP